MSGEYPPYFDSGRPQCACNCFSSRVLLQIRSEKCSPGIPGLSFTWVRVSGWFLKGKSPALGYSYGFCLARGRITAIIILNYLASLSHTHTHILAHRSSQPWVCWCTLYLSLRYSSFSLSLSRFLSFPRNRRVYINLEDLYKFEL